MAGEERDARLILQAEDRASRTFQQVAKSIKEVREELNQQVEAARRGEGSIDGINASLNKLKDLGQDLVRGQGLLRSFETLEARVEKTGNAVETAKAKLAAYQETLGAGGATTQTQIDKQTRLETAVTRTQAAYDKASTQMGVVTTRMERAGLVAGQFDAQTDRIAASAREAAAGMAVAGRAADGYADNLSRAQAEQKKLNDAQALQEAVARSPISQEDIAYILQFDNAMERLRQEEELYAREQRSTAAVEAQRKAQRNTAVNEALAGNERLMGSFTALEAEIRQADTLTAFRKIGTDAAAAALDVGRFGGAANTTQAHLSRLSSTLQAIVNPLASAAGTMEGAVHLVDQAVETATQKGGAKINEYSEAIGRLAEAQRGLVAQAGLIDAFRNQGAAVDRIVAKFEAAQAEVGTLAQRIATAETPVNEWTADLHRAETQLERLGVEMTNEKAKLQQMGLALDRAKIDVNQLDAAEAHLIATTQRAAAAQGALTARSGGKGGFLGLNPYELQNLSYQVNDVFTQLASGTPIFQIAAQQGGQFFQLFRGAVPLLIRFLPLIGLVVGALVLVGSAISRVVDHAQNLRQFDAIFKLMGDGARYSAQQFADAQRHMEDLGASAEDARAVLQRFINEGLDPARLTSFMESARDLARVTGQELPDAARLLGDAFSGGVQQLNALQDATHLFTQAELAQIRALYDAGEADRARAMTMDLVHQRTEAATAQLDGPWTRAMHNAANGWHNLIDAISSSGVWDELRGKIALATGAVQGLAWWWSYLTARMAGTSVEDANAQANGQRAPVHQAPPLNRFQQNVVDHLAANGRRVAGGTPSPGILPEAAPAGPTAEQQAYANRQTTGGQRFLQTQQQQLSNQHLLTREQRLTVAAQDAGNRAAEAGASQAEITLARTNARRIEEAKITTEEAAAARSAASAARGEESRARAEAARLAAAAERRRSAIQATENALASLDSRIGRRQDQSLEQRRAAIDSELQHLYDAITQEGALGVDPRIIAGETARLDAQKEVLKNLETQTYYEERLRDLVTARNQGLADVADSYQKGWSTAAEAMAQAAAIQARYGPQIEQTASDAFAFGRSLQTAHPNPELQRFMESVSAIGRDNSGAAASRHIEQFGNQRLTDEEGRLNNIIAQRNALVEAENSLVALGVQSRSQAQAAIEAGYARTQPALDAQLASMQALLDTLDRTNPAVAILYDTWIARLRAVRAQSTFVDARFTQMKNSIDQAITQNAVTAFDTIAQSLARMATGGQSVIQTLKDMGNAVLGFIADTLQAIARLILQMLILDAVQKITGIPIGAFLKLTQGSVLHAGGKAGSTSFGRMVPEIAFANAPRYHGGGFAGFKPNEVPAILKRNEEVLTEEDPYHSKNRGRGRAPAPPMALTINNLIDHEEFVSKGVATPGGERAVMNLIKNKRREIGQLVNQS